MDVVGSDGAQFDQVGSSSAVTRVELWDAVDVTSASDVAMTVIATDSVDIDVDLEGLTLAANIFETMARSDVGRTASVVLGAGFDEARFTASNPTVSIEEEQLVKSGTSWYRYTGADNNALDLNAISDFSTATNFVSDALNSWSITGGLSARATTRAIQISPSIRPCWDWHKMRSRSIPAHFLRTTPYLLRQ